VKHADDFSTYYAELLDGTYDCVDRIVVRAYCSVMNNPGGFRSWWRQLYGTDDALDDNHLMRLAGRFSRRVRAWGEKHGVAVIDCPKGVRKHELAEQHLPKDPDFVGVFLVLVSKVPASVWRVKRYGNGGIDVSRKKPNPFVNHYFFHLMDPEWGHVTIVVAGHPPFNAMIFLNGHEWVERQARRRGLAVQKAGNCFVDWADGDKLRQIADTLSRPGGAVGRLEEVCRRWLASGCLCFALDTEEQERSGMRHSFSLYQLEYSRNVLFRRGSDLDQVFQGFIDRTRVLLDLRKVTTIFGWQKRPRSFNRTMHRPRFELAVETLEYDLTVFKVHFGKLTLKAYSKGERVLRVESIAHNVRALNLGVQAGAFPEMVAKLCAMVARFFNALRCADQMFLDGGTLDDLPKPTSRGRRRLAGVDVHKPRMCAVLEALVALTLHPQGFTAAELAAHVRRVAGPQLPEYRPRQAAYDLKKVRAKGFIERVGSSRRYRPVLPTFQKIAALIILREKVLKPLLASCEDGRTAPAPHAPADIDVHYRNLQHELRKAFKALGLAA
jgi:hypothetical protein